MVLHNCYLFCSRFSGLAGEVSWAGPQVTTDTGLALSWVWNKLVRWLVVDEVAWPRSEGWRLVLAVSWYVLVFLPVAAHPAVGWLVFGSHGSFEVPRARDDSLVHKRFSLYQVF